MLEHEEHGDMAPNVIVDITGHLILSDVANSFDQFETGHNFLDKNSNCFKDIKMPVGASQLIDGVINNVEKGDVLEELKQAQADVKAEKEESKKADTPEKRPSVLAKLREAKEQIKQNDKQKEKNKDVERVNFFTIHAIILYYF